jgi:hypothetical protein
MTVSVNKKQINDDRVYQNEAYAATTYMQSSSFLYHLLKALLQKLTY